jgi:glycosyltransferase involved in cell wall biosynthesis
LKSPIITYQEKKLCIALISTPFFTVPPSGYSGLEQIVWDLAEALDELGHDVTIFAPDGSKATKHGHVINTGPSINTVNVNWLEEERRMYEIYKNIVVPENFDIVHGHDWFGFEFLLKISNPKLNVVHSHHGGYTWNTAPPVDQPNLVAISKFMKEYTDNYFKNKGYNVTCTAVYNGIDMRKYHINDIPKSERLLFVGRLDTFKKPDLAIEVAKKLNMGLDIVGGTFVQNEAYLNQIRCMCDGTQIKLYENASHETKIKLMQSAKCLLFTSQMGEPFGLVSIEAMSCGCPVVAINDGAIEEIVQGGGIVCDVFDKKLTTNGFEYRLKKNPLDALVEAVGKVDAISPQQARNNAEMFDRKIMAKNYERLYRRIMA